MSVAPIPRPFLKWAGGKTQLANELIARMPAGFNVYHEPFVGGGALFFRLYRDGYIKGAVLSDINAELIDTYRAIRECVEDVIELLASYPLDKDFFYALRALDPWKLALPERAARMIYLNKSGYNGLYRVNKQGKFNVPFGRYKKPYYLDFDNLRAVSRALQGVEIFCASFESVLDRARERDWVYFDPPYVPLSSTANFTSYHANGFGLEDQERLRDVCLILHERGVYTMLSNSNTQFVRKLYNAPQFHISEVLASRPINSDGAKRGKISELIITTYPMKDFVQPRLLEHRAKYSSR